MSKEIDLVDHRLIEVEGKDCCSRLMSQYSSVSKQKRQLIDSLASIYYKLIDWTSLSKAEEILPYRQIHTTKYVCGISQKGVRISGLCNHQGQQRYIGQWFTYKALINNGKKYIKFVKLSEHAKFFFENEYEKTKNSVIETYGKHPQQIQTTEI